MLPVMYGYGFLNGATSNVCPISGMKTVKGAAPECRASLEDCVRGPNFPLSVPLFATQHEFSVLSMAPSRKIGCGASVKVSSEMSPSAFS